MSLTKTRRYYLHKKINRFVKLNPWTRTIDIPITKEEEYKGQPWWKYVVELKMSGYSLQLSIV